ncbi:MAG TPA: hypothetical protein VNN80_18130 [Polyangiaceae bacterium]|nr:hypothetical protein [Polyangiaceae bacterium]HWP06550.1 hypothetical protein [Polyangiaceae bacterium]
MEVWLGARSSLGLPPVKAPDEGFSMAPDISSEAIEAAAALGL